MQFVAIGVFGGRSALWRGRFGPTSRVYIDGVFPPPNPGGRSAQDITRGYFAKADMKDAIISPATDPEVLKQFPPPTSASYLDQFDN